MTSASLTGRCILLIEDEPLIAFAIQQELQDEGAKVQTARTLASAAQLLREELSAAIVDFAWSDGNAGEICAILETRGIPFIVHSGYTPCRDVHGAAAVIAKPAQPGVLAAALRGALLACAAAAAQEGAS